MGQGGEQGMSPLERRQEIRNRRQQLLGDAGGPLGGDSSSSSPSSNNGRGGNGTGDRGSGSIGQAGSGDTGTVEGTTQDSTPSMSEVDKGTKARATDRGFGN